MFRGFTEKAEPEKNRLALLDLQPAAQGHGRSLCLVSDCSEGQSTQELASFLVRDGWNLTVLDLAKPGSPDARFPGASYQRLAGQYQETNWYIQMQSLLAYHWLRDLAFDAIVFHRTFAAGFYSSMARYLGLAFAHTPLLVLAEEAHAGRLERTLNFPSGRHDFETDFMERKTVELADGFCAMCATAERWMREAGWRLPACSACVADKASGQKAGAWLAEIVSRAKSAKVQPENQKPILISVCIATYNRATWLREALASLEAQTYSHFEVIVVDDGSSDEAVKVAQKELAPLFKSRKWKWLKQKNAGPAAARNYAAKKARGDYLLFMDDDDVCYPDEIERFTVAAKRGGAIINCILGMHPQSENTFPPTAQLPERHGNASRPVGWTPIGGDLALTAFINLGGFAHALYRRRLFKKLGGFSTARDAVFEDFEFLIRALAAGYKVDVVPEVLMLYRRTKQSRSMGQDIFAGHVHSLKFLAQLLPPPFRGLLLPLRQEWYNRHRQRRDGDL